MENPSTSSGETVSDAESAISRVAKPRSLVVNFPLTPSEIDWLRQQSKHVAEVSKRLSASEHEG
jgi:hypothetical protein